MTNLFLYNENIEKYMKWINKHQFYDETEPSVEFVKTV